MKKNKVSGMKFWVMLLLIFLPGIVMAQKEEMIIKVEHKSEHGRFKFHNPKGSVRVEGYEGNWIMISASVRGSQNREVVVPDGMELISQHQFELKAETAGNDVILYCESGRTVDFDIKIPRYFSLNIASLDNGEIEIIRVDGEVEADNKGGSVLLLNISGSTIVNTIYGNISADVRGLDSDETVMLTSYEGEIELMVEPGQGANFMLRSQEGNIFSEIDIKSEKPKISVKQNENGRIYHMDSWTGGKLNSGGSKIFLSSYAGNIIIREREKSMVN